MVYGYKIQFKKNYRYYSSLTFYKTSTILITDIIFSTSHYGHLTQIPNYGNSSLND